MRKVLKGEVIGDFKCIDDTIYNHKYIDKVTSNVLSEWDNSMHVLHNYSGHSTYSREEVIMKKCHIFLKRRVNGHVLLDEGISIGISNSTMDNIKVDIDSIFDRFRKQVMDIV